MHNKLLALAFVLAFVAPLHAQQYPFINYDANVLHYDSASRPIQVFFGKWKQMTTTGQGRLSIVHIGGSHVQAGTFPHKVRTNILSAYPSLVSGRGMIFPYSAAAKCNNPHDYKVHCVEKVGLTRNVYKNPEHPMGLCGISITAHDTATRVQILNTDKQFDYAVSRIVVLGHSPNGVVPSISYAHREIPPSYVDTATHRYVFNLRTTVDSFDIFLPCGRGQEFTLTGVCLDSRQPGFTYHAIGVNGAAVPDYFKCALKDDLKLIHPDLVIFGIGINDAHSAMFDSARFQRNYLRLCDSVRSINPDCAFIFITNNDCYRKTGKSGYAVNTNGLLVRDVCYRLAEITGGAVWDQFEIMGGLRSMERWQKAGLAQADKVHFTRSGYLLLGDLLYQAITRELGKSWKPVKAVNAAKRPQHATPAKPHATQSPASQSAKSTPTYQSSDNDGLPRGLRRKPKPQNSKPQTSKSSSNAHPDSDRFPYIPD